MRLHVTIDHQVILSWAQRRGARPSTFDGDEHPWPLFFILDPDAGLTEISWDRFFAEFERAQLAFVYREDGRDNERDDLHEFVQRAAVPALIVSGKTTIIEAI